MPSVAVRILHPLPDPAAGPLVRWAGDARAAFAEQHRRGFESAGASDVAVIDALADERSFGARLQGLIDDLAVGAGGLVVLGSGSMPLATLATLRAFVAAAGSAEPRALANNRYSSDAIAIARVDSLPRVPELPGDNALPRWLAEVGGYPVKDFGRRWRLGVDIDGPLDMVLTGTHEAPSAIDLGPVRARLAAVREVAMDHRAELLVAGRTSATTLAWLERHTASRTRAFVEERGLRAASRLAQAAGDRSRTQRPPASVLGAHLDHDGPASFGDRLARFADAAIVDTRVLMAHRLGADEAAWPDAEDRFASDLLLPDRIADPWLRDLTASAATAPIPILLGGHTLVGPGVRLIMAATWS